MLNSKPAELHGLLSEELPAIQYPREEQNLVPSEYQLAMGGAVGSAARSAVRRPMSEMTGGVMSKAYQRLQELQARQKELEGVVDDATVKLGDESLSRDGIDLRTDEVRPAPRYDIKQTDEGFEVLDQATDQPLGIFMRREEADAYRASLTPEKPVIEEPAVEGAAPRTAAADDGTLYEVPPDGPASLVQEQTEGGSYEFFKLDDDQAEAIAQNRLNQPDLKDGMLGGVRMAGAGGDAKIPDEGNVRNLIGEMAVQIQKNVDSANWETMTTEAQLDMADFIGSNPKRLLEGLKRGFQIDITKPGALGAHIMAAKSLLASEVRKLDELADVALNGTLQDKLAWKQQADLVANIHNMYKGAQTNIARSLGLLRSPVRNLEGIPPNEVADIMKRDFSRLAENYGGEESLDAAIDAYRKAADPADRIEIISGGSRMRRIFNAWHEVWINSILSGPWTHVKNVAGGLAAILNDTSEDLFAAISGKLTGNDSITFGDVRAKVFGQMMAQNEALAAVGKGFITREELFGSSKLDFRSTGAGGRRATAQGYDAFSPEALGTTSAFGTSFVRIAGNILTLGRAPTRTLVAGDAYVKVVAYRGSLYEQAFREGRLAGHEGDNLSEFIADFLFDPPIKATEKAQAVAREVTLQTPLTGGLKNLHRVLKGPVSKWIVPFYSTPTNALLYMRDRSPAYLITQRYRDAIAEGGAAAAKARAQWQMGSAVMASVLTLAMTDDEAITGNISSNSRVADAYERQGIKKYSFRFPGTDSYVPYNMFEPVSSIIGVAVDVAEAIKSTPDMDDRDAYELIFAAIGTIGYNLTNKSFMIGVSKFMEMLQDPKRKAGAFVKNYAASAFLPGSQLLDQTRRVIDDTKRFRRDVLDNITSKIPGLASNLKPQRDAWGRETMQHRALSPYNPNPVDDELMRSRYPWAKYPTQLNSEFTYKDAEIDYLHEVTGKKAYELMQKYLKKSSYKKLRRASERGNVMATQQLHSQFSNIRSMAMEYGRKKLFKHPEFGPDLREAVKMQADFNRKQRQKFKDATR